MKKSLLLILVVIICGIFVSSCSKSLKGKRYIADLDYLPLYFDELCFLTFNVAEDGKDVSDKYVLFSETMRGERYDVDGDTFNLNGGIPGGGRAGKIKGNSIILEVEVKNGFVYTREKKEFVSVSKAKWDEVMGLYKDGRNTNFK